MFIAAARMMHHAGWSVTEGTVFHLRQPIKLMGSHRRGVELGVTLGALVVAFQDDPVGPFKMKISRALGRHEFGHRMTFQADLVLDGNTGAG